MRYLLLCIAVLLTSCDTNHVVVSKLQEREANLIVVFLEGHNIPAYKNTDVVSGIGSDSANTYNISVGKMDIVKAMSLLNKNGLPRQTGTTLIELFPKSGLVSSDKEEQIRYQSGLTSQINNMILIIDGVLESKLQISFGEDNNALSASVFVKHQGILDDPNSHLELKIKRLISGSIKNLNIEDITVVSDISRLTEVSVNQEQMEEELVKIWFVTMNLSSVRTFRILFFSMITLLLLLLAIISWTIWKVYPIVSKHGGFGKFFKLTPFFENKKKEE